MCGGKGFLPLHPTNFFGSPSPLRNSNACLLWCYFEAFPRTELLNLFRVWAPIHSFLQCGGTPVENHCCCAQLTSVVLSWVTLPPGKTALHVFSTARLERTVACVHASPALGSSDNPEAGRRTASCCSLSLSNPAGLSPKQRHMGQVDQSHEPVFLGGAWGGCVNWEQLQQKPDLLSALGLLEHPNAEGRHACDSPV